MKKAELIEALNAIDDPNDSDVMVRVNGETTVNGTPAKVHQPAGGQIIIEADVIE